LPTKDYVGSIQEDGDVSYASNSQRSQTRIFTLQYR